MVDARGTAGVIAMVCALGLVGCTPDTISEPTPSPTPAVQTPTESAAEKQERLDYAAAERAYRTFRAEYGRVLRAGGAKEPTMLMKQTAGGEYLKAFAEVGRGYRILGSRTEGSEVARYVRPAGYSEKSIILNVCEDSSDVVIIRTKGANGRGEIRTAELRLRKLHGVWKLWSGNGKLVDSCE